jgi:geranylgeranyl diphosphate synthase type II
VHVVEETLDGLWNRRRACRVLLVSCWSTALEGAYMFGISCRAVPPLGATSVAPALDRRLDAAAVVAGDLGASYARLWGAVCESTEGGKRFRPALFTTAYESWDGADTMAAAEVAAALELLHTAFVVHDDVIDHDLVRRGRSNVVGSHVRFAESMGATPARSNDFGVAAGILAGDLALAAAIRTVAGCPCPRETVQRLLDLFDRALHVTAAGELCDVQMALGVEEPSLSDTLTMEERKTGVYSFALPLQAAAVLAGQPPDVVDAVEQVGRLLGVAFQLADDLVGVFGDPAVTGKSAVRDLRSGKQTPLMAHARGTRWWPRIAPYVGDEELDASQAEQVRLLLIRSGSRRYVEELAASHGEAALGLARDHDLPPRLVASLSWLIEDLLGRAA